MIKDPKRPAGNVARKVNGSGFLDHFAAFLNIIALQVVLGVKQLGGLKRFIAKEDEFDGRMMMRLGAWGVGSVVTLVIAIIAVQSPASARRDQASAEVTQQSQRIAKDSQNQTRQLAAAMDTLNKDRDRLYNRVTVIEQALDSVNGSISKLATSPVVASAPAPAAPVSVSSPTSSQPASQSAVLEPVTTPQVEVPMASSQPSPDVKSLELKSLDAKQRAAEAKALEAKIAEARFAEAKIAEAKIAEAKKEAAPAPKIASVSTVAPPAAPAAAKNEQKAEEAKSAAKLEAKSPSKSPDQASVSDQVPSVTGSVATADVPNADNDAEKPVQRTKFGIDLGGANSVEGLRALWRGVRGPHRDMFASMQPLIVVKERTTGYGMQLRLVAGPLDDAAAAAKICATLTTNSRRTCEPTVYDGQRLAVRADLTNQGASNDPAKSNPSTANASTTDAEKTEAAKNDPTKKREASNYRRRGHVRTVAPPPAPVAAPAPPPQRWSLSTIFSGRQQ